MLHDSVLVTRTLHIGRLASTLVGNKHLCNIFVICFRFCVIFGASCSKIGIAPFVYIISSSLCSEGEIKRSASFFTNRGPVRWGCEGAVRVGNVLPLV